MLEKVAVECCEACGLPQHKVLDYTPGKPGWTGLYYKHNVPEDCAETFKTAILNLYRWAEKKR